MRRTLVDTRKRLKLFGAGVFLGVGMFLVGGVGVVGAHAAPEPTVQLQPWLQRTVSNYPPVDCTSRGPVETSPALPRIPA
jgi:hypothetical protein